MIEVEQAATEKSSEYAHGKGWRKCGAARFLWMIESWSDRKIGSFIGSKRHCEQEATRWAAFPDASGRGELSSGLPWKLKLPSAKNIIRPQESTKEPWQLRLVSDVEDRGVVDARVCSGEVRQEDLRLSLGARHMRQGSRLNFEDVTVHLPGRDNSLSQVYASDGVCASQSVSPWRLSCSHNNTVSTDVLHQVVSQ